MITAPTMRFRDDQDRAIYHEVWIDEVYERVRRVGPGDIVIDAGSHAGYFSVKALMAGAKHVLSFEPASVNHQILKEHLAFAPAERSSIYPVALGSKYEGSSLSCTPRNTGGNSINHKWLDEDAYVEKIRVDCLSAFIYGDFCPVTFIKIDVEGYELEVLKGAHTIIESHLPFITAEIHSYELGCEVYKWLKTNFNYKISPEEPPQQNGWIMHAQY